MTTITKRAFGRAGSIVCSEFLLSNEFIEVGILELGAAIHTILVGGRLDVVHGFDTAREYYHAPPYFGLVVGPVAGRIKNSQFYLDGRKFLLDKGDGAHLLHSGAEGFSHKLFTAEIIGGEELLLTYRRPVGEGGFPGNLDFSVSYSLERGALVMRYEAASDADTPFNPTNHSFFDLSCEGKLDDCTLSVAASRICEADADFVFDGGIASVSGTAFDFRAGAVLSERIFSDDMARAGGLDNCFIFDAPDLKRVQAELFSPRSGLSLSVRTDAPCAVIYSANSLDAVGKGGVHHGAHSALCIETQELSAQHGKAEFVPILRRGEKYSRTTVFDFST